MARCRPRRYAAEVAEQALDAGEDVRKTPTRREIEGSFPSEGLLPQKQTGSRTHCSRYGGGVGGHGKVYSL